MKVEYALRVDGRTAQDLATLTDAAEEVCAREDSRRSAILLELAMTYKTCGWCEYSVSPDIYCGV